MKKRFYIKTALLSLTSLTFLSSCLKDNSHYVDFAASKPLVELPVATGVGANGGEFQSVAFAISTTPAVLDLLVNVAAPKPLSTSLNVKFSVNAAALTAYNAANKAADSTAVQYILLPAADYSSTLSVTIPANQNSANLVININTSLIDASQKYILPLTITDGGGQQISNYNTVLYNVQVKNAYDGVYNLKGFVFRDVNGANDPALGGNFSALTQSLVTTNATSVTLTPIWSSGAAAAGVGGTTISVNPTTNAATISSTANATLKNAAGYNSHYDPTVKTFYVSYTWGTAPNDRAETDTLVYSGSR